MVFVVKYLDVKFKVDKGSGKKRQDTKKKEKTKDTVLCSFYYSTLVQVTNGFLDQVVEYVRKKFPLALPVCDFWISSQFQDDFGFYLFLRCKNFERNFFFRSFCMSKINKIQNYPDIHMF